MKRHLLIASFIAALIAVSGSTAYAVRGSDETSESHGPSVNALHDDVKQAVESSRDDSATAIKETTEDVMTKADDRVARIQARKDELKQRLEEKATERKTRLEGRRLAVCENRQTTINALIDRSANNGKLQLDNISRVQTRVVEFANKKSLDPSTYSAAMDAANVKKDEAVAAMQVIGAQNFSCSDVNGTSPAAAIRLSVKAKHDALVGYRDSVINLIHVVKEAYAQTVAKDDAQSEEAR